MNAWGSRFGKVNDLVRAGMLLRERMARLLIVLFAGLVVSGCATAGSTYAPATSFTTAEDIQALKQHYSSATSIQAYYADPPETEQKRNEFIAGRLVLNDLAYADFMSHFRLNRATESTLIDTATLGVNAATTLFGGARTKQVLGAIAGAITGVRSSYEKNFFDEQAATALIAQMNAERKAALVPIMAGTKARIADYPLTAALIDLNTYQFAGTLEGAIMGIQREAGLKEAAASARLDQYRSVAYAADDATDRLLKWLYPGAKTFDPNGIVRDAAGNPVTKNRARVTAVEAELAKLGLDGLPVGTLLVSGDLASVRAKIVNNLQVP